MSRRKEGNKQTKIERKNKKEKSSCCTSQGKCQKTWSGQLIVVNTHLMPPSPFSLPLKPSFPTKASCHRWRTSRIITSNAQMLPFSLLFYSQSLWNAFQTFIFISVWPRRKHLPWPKTAVFFFPSRHLTQLFLHLIFHSVYSKLHLNINLIGCEDGWMKWEGVTRWNILIFFFFFLQVWNYLFSDIIFKGNLVTKESVQNALWCMFYVHVCRNCSDLIL